jgi:hypothetical protein
MTPLAATHLGFQEQAVPFTNPIRLITVPSLLERGKD